MPDIEEKKERKEVIELIKLEFEYVAIFAVIYTLVDIDFSNLNWFQSAHIIIMFIPTFISILLLAYKIIMDYIFKNKVNEKTISLTYKFMMYQIAIFIVGIIGYFASSPPLNKGAGIVTFCVLLILFFVPLVKIIPEALSTMKKEKRVKVNETEGLDEKET